VKKTLAQKQTKTTQSDNSTDKTESLHVVEVIVNMPRKAKQNYYTPLCYYTDRKLHKGNIVIVPYGKGDQEKTGVVVGEGDKTKATKEIIEIVEPKISTEHLKLFETYMQNRFANPKQYVEKLYPRNVTVQNLSNWRKQRNPSKREVGTRKRNFDWKVQNKSSDMFLMVDQQTNLAEVVGALAVGEQKRNNGQVLVLVGEKTQAQQIVEELTGSRERLSSAESYLNWRNGETLIGVGTVGTCWWEAANLGSIIVVEPSHVGHQNRTNPYIDNLSSAYAQSRKDVSMHIVTQQVCLNPYSEKLQPCVVTAKTPKRQTHIQTYQTQNFDPTQRRAPNEVVKHLKQRQSLLLVGSSKARRLCANCKETSSCTVCKTHLCNHNKQLCKRCGHEGFVWVGYDLARGEQLRNNTRLLCDVKTVAQLHQTKTLYKNIVVLDAYILEEAGKLNPKHATYTLLKRVHNHLYEKGQLHLLLNGQTNLKESIELLESRNLLQTHETLMFYAKEQKLWPYATQTVVESEKDLENLRDKLKGNLYGPVKRSNRNRLTVIAAPDEEKQNRKALNTLKRKGNVRINTEARWL